MSTARPPLDQDGNKRPAFLLNYPEHPQLEPLIEAFCKGNYALVRDHAPRVAQATEGAVRDAALELRRRVDLDGLTKWLFVSALAFLLFVALWTYGWAH